MPATIDKATFDQIYTQRPPWDIDGAQKSFRDVQDRVTGRVLDSGCGSGEIALYFAARGLDVTGIDFVDVPIQQAEQKARARNLSARFLVKDSLRLTEWDERFDTALDSGLFHVFSDADRARYVEGLATVLKPGGRLFLLCFSERTPGDQGPRRVTEPELRQTFSGVWTIESLERAEYEVRPEFLAQRFFDAHPQAWFLSARRG